MALPYSDPSNPALPSPLFSDLAAVRADHMRANNAAIFADLEELDARNPELVALTGGSFKTAALANANTYNGRSLFTCTAGVSDTPYAGVWRIVGVWNPTDSSGRFIAMRDSSLETWEINYSSAAWGTWTKRTYESPAVRSYKNITIKRNATKPNYQLDWTATEVWIGGFYEASLSGTVDITVSGAGGLRAGLSEAVSTWYYLHLWSGPGVSTVAQLDTSRYAPVAPAGGYTQSQFIGPWRNNSGGNFESGILTDTYFAYANEKIFISGSASMGAEVDVDCREFIPEDVHNIRLRISHSDSAAGTGTIATVYANGHIAGGTGNMLYSNNHSGAAVSAVATLAGAIVTTDNRYIIFRGFTEGGGGTTPSYFGIIRGFYVRNK